MISTLFSEELKQQTLTPHRELEAGLVIRIKQISTPADYAGLLQLFHSYFGGIEQQVHKNLDLRALPDYDDRRKSKALANDLQCLGYTPPLFAAEADLPLLNTHLQAFGALYVMEGSTLGGKYIAKMITERLGPSTADCLTFFNGYGDKTEMMWMRFKQALNEQVENHADEQEVIAAANATFAGFKKWIDNNG